jgi:hypothetical protein
MAQTKEGAIKVAAQKANLSVKEYLDLLANGYKKCTFCKKWKSLDNFANDKSRSDGKASRCNGCAKGLWRKKTMFSNKREERRDGDKRQAKARINHDVGLGIRPNPNNLYCSFCGHKGKDKRHEYHHIMGYSAEHHYDVLPLCSGCHHKQHPRNKNHEQNRIC